MKAIWILQWVTLALITITVIAWRVEMQDVYVIRGRILQSLESLAGQVAENKRNIDELAKSVGDDK